MPEPPKTEPPKTAQPEAVAEIGRLYRDTDIPVAELAARLEVGRSRFYQLRRQQGWGLREPWKSSAERAGVLGENAPSMRGWAAPGGVPLARAGGSKAPERVLLARRLQRLLAQKIRGLERGAALADADPERAARALASLARTLKQVLEIAAPASAPEDCDGTDRAARSPDELRERLHRHMLRLREQRCAAQRARRVQRR